MIRRPPRSTLFPTRRSSDLPERRSLGRHHHGHRAALGGHQDPRLPRHRHDWREDRKSTRLNSSHSQISYAVFCLKKKKKNKKKITKIKTIHKKTINNRQR